MIKGRINICVKHSSNSLFSLTPISNNPMLRLINNQNPVVHSSLLNGYLWYCLTQIACPLPHRKVIFELEEAFVFSIR